VVSSSDSTQEKSEGSRSERKSRVSELDDGSEEPAGGISESYWFVGICLAGFLFMAKQIAIIDAIIHRQLFTSLPQFNNRDRKDLAVSVKPNDMICDQAHPRHNCLPADDPTTRL
jgi:hypothetical protein